MLKIYDSPIVMINYSDERTITEVVEILEENTKVFIDNPEEITERRIIITNNSSHLGWKVSMQYKLKGED